MKNVVFIFHDSNIYSGATASLIDLISGFKSEAYLKLAIIPKNKNNEKLKAALKGYGVECYEFTVPMTRFWYKNTLIKKSATYVYAFINVIRCFFISMSIKAKMPNIDLIYSNTSATCLGISLSNLIKKSRHVFHIREFGREDQNMSQVFGERFFYSRLEKSSDDIIVISKALNEKVSSYISSSLVNLIYDDVRVENCQPGSDLNMQPLKLLLTGNICKGKGQEFLIRAVSFLKEKKKNINIELGFAGNDTTSYARALKKLAVELNVDKYVKFHGFCNDMNSIRQQYNVSVVASSSEAFGRVTIEAMSFNHLVLAVNKGANVELITDKNNGILFEYGSYESFCDSIEYIYEDQFRAQKIAENGNNYSMKYTSGAAAQKVEKIILKNLMLS